MLELRATHQEPICCFVAVSIAANLTFDCVEDGNWFFGLFLLLQLLVLLNDCIALFQFALVSFNLICREGHSSETVENWNQILGCQAVLGQTEELK